MSDPCNSSFPMCCPAHATRYIEWAKALPSYLDSPDLMKVVDRCTDYLALNPPIAPLSREDLQEALRRRARGLPANPRTYTAQELLNAQVSSRPIQDIPPPPSHVSRAKLLARANGGT